MYTDGLTLASGGVVMMMMMMTMMMMMVMMMMTTTTTMMMTMMMMTMMMVMLVLYCLKLQALFYDILPSTIAVFSYEQCFVGAQTVVSLLQTTQIKQGVSFTAANIVYTSTNKTAII